MRHPATGHFLARRRIELRVLEVGSLVRRLFWWVPFGKVPEVTPSELNGKLRSGSPPQILDVRTRGEFRQGHIEGALNVPIIELRSKATELPFDRGRPVFAVCLTAHRSIPAVRILNDHGYRQVAQLAGGMVAWHREGLPTEVGSSP
jgi:rhodanese-related sulfurtransferase